MRPSRFVVQDYAGVTVVTFSDHSLLDSGAIDQLGRDLAELVDQKNKQRLILDFANVRLLSSHCLGVLLNLDKKSKAIKGTLVLCGIRKELMKAFSATGLDKMFRFYPDDVAALESFNVHVK